jgi:hypothetical protein
VPVPEMVRRCPVAPPPPPDAAAVWRVAERAGQREALLLGRAPRTATSVQAAIQGKQKLDSVVDPDPQSSGYPVSGSRSSIRNTNPDPGA